MHPLRGILVFAAQVIAGIASAGVVSCLFPGALNAGTRLGGGTSISQGLFIEMFLTANLVFVVIMLAVVKQKSTFLAPIGIGLVLFVNQLVGTYYTGCALNPARALGPDVINRSFPGYHWIYWIGPLLGSLLACGFFGFLSIFHYDAVNPGQDFNEWEADIHDNYEDKMGRQSEAFSDASKYGHSRHQGDDSLSPNARNEHEDHSTLLQKTELTLEVRCETGLINNISYEKELLHDTVPVLHTRGGLIGSRLLKFLRDKMWTDGLCGYFIFLLVYRDNSSCFLFQVLPLINCYTPALFMSSVIVDILRCSE